MMPQFMRAIVMVSQFAKSDRDEPATRESDCTGAATSEERSR